MVSINASVEVNASVSKIWNIVAEVERDSEYWKGLNSARIKKKEENLVEREVNVGFMGHKGHQVVKLYPQRLVEISMIDGPMVGARKLELVPLGAESTRLEVSWNFQFSKVPIFARGFVKSQIESVTKEALEKIALDAEGTPIQKKVVLVTSS